MMLSTCNVILAGLHEDLGDLGEAARHYDLALRTQQAVVEQFPQLILHQYELADRYHHCGRFERKRRDADRAALYHRKAADLGQAVADREPDNALYLLALARNRIDLGDLLGPRGLPHDALDQYGLALDTLGRLRLGRAEESRVRALRAEAYRGKATALTQLQRHADAAANWERVVHLQIEREAEGWRQPPEATLLPCAEALARSGQHARAAALLADVPPPLSVPLRRVSVPDPTGEHAYRQARVAAVCCGAAGRDAALSAADRARQQETHARRALALLDRARQLGHFRAPGRVETIRKEPDFDSLRPRDEFQQFLRALGP
jgi:tetratricopeptide (TPR) repeat protein